MNTSSSSPLLQSLLFFLFPQKERTKEKAPKFKDSVNFGVALIGLCCYCAARLRNAIFSRHCAEVLCFVIATKQSRLNVGCSCYCVSFISFAPPKETNSRFSSGQAPKKRPKFKDSVNFGVALIGLYCYCAARLRISITSPSFILSSRHCAEVSRSVIATKQSRPNAGA